MEAFFGKTKIKKKYLTRVKKHRELDNLIQGQGWQDGKGCAVGCTLENYDHAQYEVELGIPQWLARVEDTIFEGLTKDQAMFWPERFLSSINPGADLDKVKTPFLIYILEQNLKTLDSLPEMQDFPEVMKALEGSRAATIEMIRCHKEGIDLSAARFSAESASRLAAWSTASAAASVAWSTASAAASVAWSTASAARSAAASVAWSAASAAASVAWSTASAARSAARSPSWSAESAAYSDYADKLVELLRKTKATKQKKE